MLETRSTNLSAARGTPAAGDLPHLVQHLLDEAAAQRASDVHIEPTAAGYDLKYRVDGLLEHVQSLDAGTGRGVVTRLMVLARLLTYRLDVPQEGRLSAALPSLGATLELRLSIMPTTHGLRAVVRMPAELSQPRMLGDLGLPASVLESLYRYAAGDSGLLIFTGPAGSGKTTSIYALLEHIATTSEGSSIISLEDPVERDLPGVTQVEVSPFGQLTYERALKSILRQDPQVLALGEIRDRATASLAVQAALSGHRLICTLHAGTCGGAVARVVEMGLEPYQIASSLWGVVGQRLLRRVSGPGEYCGRVPAAEIAMIDAPLRDLILQRSDAGSIEQHLRTLGDFEDMRGAAADLVARGLTDQKEVDRVFGAP